MMFRCLHFVQKLKPDRAHFVERLQGIWQKAGFALLMILATFCSPKATHLVQVAKSSTAPISAQPSAPTQQEQENQIPVLAFYYIWFDNPSWDRAKTDYPLLGRYSSDEPEVMRQHVEWAKEAGIDGFIVSWKSTEKLNGRLAQLVQIAGQENFELAIIYESLDFERNPLPLAQVDSDLEYFIDQYASHPAFDLFEKPMVIWSGTWEYSAQDIASVAQEKRDQIHILASEKNVKGYQRLSGIVDGDAYYWSSVDPDTHPGYVEKLVAMGDAVHDDGGLWVAPAAPGFDSRLLGEDRVVHRESGDTLQKELNAAFQSAPDAVGLISWNEFSENSHIEPSQIYGFRYLEFLAEILPVVVTPK